MTVNIKAVVFHESGRLPTIWGNTEPPNTDKLLPGYEVSHPTILWYNQGSSSTVCSYSRCNWTGSSGSFYQRNFNSIVYFGILSSFCICAEANSF
jgi:hypothetical protein